MDFWYSGFTPQVQHILPTIAIMLVSGLLCFLTWLATRYLTNEQWRARIRDYMPELARTALEAEQARADSAESVAKAAADERDVLAAELSAVRQIVSSPLSLVREQLRKAAR